MKKGAKEPAAKRVRKLPAAERQRRENKTRFLLLLIVACYALAVFLVWSGNDQEPWLLTLDYALALVLVVLAVVLLIWATSVSEGTRLRAPLGLMGWLINLIGFLVFTIAVLGDDLAFLGTVAGIGAGIATQAAFHYGFIDVPPKS